MKLGNTIRRLRFDAHEMSQQELADLIGVSRMTIYSIEKGNYTPSTLLALKIARVLTPRLKRFSISTKRSVRMKKYNLRKMGFNLLGILSFLGLLGSLWIYRTLQPQLIPANAIPTPEMNSLGNLPVPILFISAIYHVILFLYALQFYRSEPRILFLHSLYVVGLILSGINLLTDVTILADIGNEYPYWDINGYWVYLYLDTVFHLGIVGLGLVFTWNAPEFRMKDLFQQIRNGDDFIFRSIHHMGLICAVIGFVGIYWAVRYDVGESYRAGYVLLAVVFALFPRAFMVAYWGIRNSKKPLLEWMDEKQFSDMAFGSLVMTTVSMPLIAGFAILSGMQVIQMPGYAWLMLVFMLMLGCHSLVMVWKNSMFIK